jgi:polysaccharide biosynthesis/export protein
MRRLRFRPPLLRVLLLLAVGCAGLCAASASSTPAAPAPDVSLTYTIVPTDRLRIAVFQEPDLSVIARVDAKGLVNLPLTGEVPVAGLTIAEAQRRVEAAYRSGRYLRSPQVTINVEEYAARTISVQGEVRNPGQLTLPIEAGMTILDAITRSGGFTDVARGNAVSVTRPLPNGTTRVFTVDVQSYIRGERRARPDETLLLLLPGDVVYVPQRII